MVEKKVRFFFVWKPSPAALFVQTASRFSSSIKVKVGTKIVNAKSIMGIISLGILDGQDVTLLVDGDDEMNAASELKKFLVHS